LIGQLQLRIQPKIGEGNDHGRREGIQSYSQIPIRVRDRCSRGGKGRELRGCERKKKKGINIGRTGIYVQDQQRLEAGSGGLAFGKAKFNPLNMADLPHSG
jgi:hypothetical protein